jgi:hypothetical protein
VSRTVPTFAARRATARPRHGGLRFSRDVKLNRSPSTSLPHLKLSFNGAAYRRVRGAQSAAWAGAVALPTQLAALDLGSGA